MTRVLEVRPDRMGGVGTGAGGVGSGVATPVGGGFAEEFGGTRKFGGTSGGGTPLGMGMGAVGGFVGEEDAGVSGRSLFVGNVSTPLSLFLWWMCGGRCSHSCSVAPFPHTMARP